MTFINTMSKLVDVVAKNKVNNTTELPKAWQGLISKIPDESLPSHGIMCLLIESADKQEMVERINTELSVIRENGDGDYLTPIDCEVFNWDKNPQLRDDFQRTLDSISNNIIDVMRYDDKIPFDADKWVEYAYRKAIVVNGEIEKVKNLLDRYDGVSQKNIERKILTPELPNVTMHDFFKMESFNCVSEFYMDGLYTFLRDNKVIKNVSKEYLYNCIYHARLDLLLRLPQKQRKANKLKYTFHILKEYMEEDWITRVCELSKFSPSQLSGANLTDKVKFGSQLKDSLKIPQ